MILVGAREPTIFAKNRQSQKPAPAIVLCAIDPLKYNVKSVLKIRDRTGRLKPLFVKRSPPKRWLRPRGLKNKVGGAVFFLIALQTSTKTVNNIGRTIRTVYQNQIAVIAA
jgi:hypothetical protein